MRKPEERCEVVLFFPFWSQAGAMNFDSNYVIMRRILPILTKMRPKWHFVVAWPINDFGSNWKIFADDFDLTRITLVPWRFDSAMRMGVLNFNSQDFKAIDLQFFPTIFWLHQVEIGTFISRGAIGSFADASLPAVVAQHHYIIHKSLPYEIADQFARRWLQMGGSIAADCVVLNSYHTLDMMFESFSEYLSPVQLEDLRLKSEVNLFGLVDDAFDIPVKSATAQSRRTVVYNHRFEHYKQPKKTAQVLRNLKKKFDFDILATQSIGQPIKTFPVDKFVGDPDYRQYLKNIALPAVNTINSVHETFCIAMTDSIALGHLPVVPNAVTFPELLPEDYPYKFNSLAQQEQMIHYIFETWPQEHHKWSQKLRDFAKEKFAIEDYCQRYISILERESAKKRYEHTTKSHNAIKFDRFAEQLQAGIYEPKQLFSRFRKLTKLGEQSTPNRRIFREIDDRRNVTIITRNRKIMLEIA